MSERLRAYLELVRIPNVFTAAADIIAGFLYVGGESSQWRTLLQLAVASACLYGGGAALNDVCDTERDARERPGRPIPSGRISRREALLLAVVLLGAGLCSAAWVSTRAVVTAVLLVAAIVLYDVVLRAPDRTGPSIRAATVRERFHRVRSLLPSGCGSVSLNALKKTVLAPGMMGLCRALNLTLGMSAVGRVSPAENTVGQSPLYELVPAVLLWLYVTSVTCFARREAGISDQGQLRAGAVGASAAVCGLSSLYWMIPHVHAGYLPAVVLLAVFVAHRGLTTAANPDPSNVQRTVKLYVMCIVLFDTCIAWAARGPIPALVVGSMLVPTAVVSRRFRMT